MAEALLTCPDRTPALAKLDAVPMMVLYGENDDAWDPAAQEDMAARLRAQRVCIPAAAHSPAVEAPAVASVGDGSAQGASVVLVQQWEHLPTFAALSPTQQEAVIGRTLDESIELEGDDAPADSHVARTVVEEGAEELAIYRRNTAWGGPTRHGTMFVGFCATQHPLQVMLERMAGLPDGVRDALTRHAVALTGAYYVAPALEALARFLPPEE